MESTIPADLLEIKGRFETWRTTRKYMREPIPDERELSVRWRPLSYPRTESSRSSPRAAAC